MHACRSIYIYIYIHESIHPYIYILISLSACLQSACLPVCLSACLPVCLSACLPVCLSACLPVCLSACPPVGFSACLPASQSALVAGGQAGERAVEWTGGQAGRRAGGQVGRRAGVSKFTNARVVGGPLGLEANVGLGLCFCANQGPNKDLLGSTRVFSMISLSQLEFGVVYGVGACVFVRTGLGTVLKGLPRFGWLNNNSTNTRKQREQLKSQRLLAQMAEQGRGRIRPWPNKAIGSLDVA